MLRGSDIAACAAACSPAARTTGQEIKGKTWRSTQLTTSQQKELQWDFHKAGEKRLWNLSLLRTNLNQGLSTEVCDCVCVCVFPSPAYFLPALLSPDLTPLLLALLWDIGGLLLSVQEIGCSCCIRGLESKASLKKKKKKQQGERGKKHSSQCLQCAAFLFVQTRILQTVCLLQEYPWNIRRLRNTAPFKGN